MAYIIKKGKIKEHKTTCPACGCKFSFRENEVMYTGEEYYNQILFGEGVPNSVKCPCCNKYVDIKWIWDKGSKI